MAGLVDFILYGLVATPWLIFAFERKWRVFTRIRDRLDQVKLGPKLGLWGVFSYFLIVGLFLVGFWGLNFAGQNPVTYTYIAGHWTSWLFIVLVVAKYGHLDFLRGLYAAGFLYFVHEALWFLTYLTTHLDEASRVLGYYWPLETILLGIAAGYFGAWRVIPPRKELVVVAMMAAFYFLWGFAGFHTSVDALVQGAKTQYFLDPDVNLVEVVSWVMPALVLIL